MPASPPPGGAPLRPLVLHAYLMLAEPYFLRESILSYYGIVDRLVVSFDRTHRSWTGRPLDVDALIAIVESVDTEGKVQWLPGEFSRPDHPPLESDTRQRRASLAAAGVGADWVLQLDTDEVVPDPAALVAAIENADAAGRDAVDFPARWLYAQVDDTRYLEMSTRFWRTAASYPGPVAVRPGVDLVLARQTPASLWRVDFRARNTDPDHARDAPVDDVIDVDRAVLHYTWVRPEAALRAKAKSSGHAHEFDWDAAIDCWAFRTRHPRWTVALTPLPRRRPPRFLRIGRVPAGRPG